MPRKEPKLVPFLQKALEKNDRNKKSHLNLKYRNLIYEDLTKKVFSLHFPHKKESLSREDELIFKDWYAETGRIYYFYKDYSAARQAMTQSLRKSDYVNMKLYDNKLTVWILTKEEVREKKRLQKLKAEQKSNEQDAMSDLGYDSGFNSPESCEDNEDNILQGIEHDHAYGFSPPVRGLHEENDFQYNQQKDTNEAIVDNNMKDTSGVFHTLGLDELSNLDNSSQIKSHVMDVCSNEDFSVIPGCSENVTLKELCEIPDEKFIGTNFQELQLTSQVPAFINAKGKNSVKCYICKHCEVMKEAAILLCQLYEERDVDIADNSGTFGIMYDKTVQEKLSEYHLKNFQHIDDRCLMVIFERSFMNQRY